MRWLPEAAGIAAGALNYLLLATACRRLLRAKRSGVLWMLAALAVPIAGLFYCALRRPQALLAFGLSCAAALVVFALAGGVAALLRGRRRLSNSEDITERGQANAP